MDGWLEISEQGYTRSAYGANDNSPGKSHRNRYLYISQINLLITEQTLNDMFSFDSRIKVEKSNSETEKIKL